MQDLILRPDYAAIDPLREPTWRFDRVLSLTPQSGKKPRLSRWDDKYIKGFRRLYLAHQSGNDTEFKKEASRNPAMFLAWSIHLRREEATRSHIDARILARQSNEQIAATTGSSAEVVDMYERLFFNVRDRLEMRDWIVRQIFQSESSRFLSRADDPLLNRDITLRYFGYFSGGIILDAIISRWHHNPVPTDVSEINDYFDRHIVNTIKARSAEAARAFEVNRYTVIPLMETYCRFRELLAKEDGDGSGDQLKESHKKATLAAIKESTYMFTATQIREDMQKRGLTDLTNFAAEPREEELIACYAGDCPPENIFGDEIKQLRIGPPQPVNSSEFEDLKDD